MRTPKSRRSIARWIASLGAALLLPSLAWAGCGCATCDWTPCGDPKVCYDPATGQCGPNKGANSYWWQPCNNGAVVPGNDYHMQYASTTPSCSQSADDMALLGKYAPYFRYTQGEAYFPEEAKIVGGKRVRGDQGRRVYGRVVRKNGKTYLQYHIYYYHNPALGTGLPGEHEGDWEYIHVQLNGDTPYRTVYARHGKPAACSWENVTRSGTTPLVYPARHSHASYYRPGTYHGNLDKALGDFTPDSVPPPVSNICEQDWLDWTMRFGNTRKKHVCVGFLLGHCVSIPMPGHADSPKAPRQQKQWDPEKFDNAPNAEECTTP